MFRSASVAAVFCLLWTASIARAAWITTTPLPDGYSSHALVYWNGFLYHTGGSSATRGLTDGTNVFYSQLGGGGTVGLWKATTSLPAAVSGHAGVAANGYVYVLGGEHYSTNSGATPSSTVYYAKTNSDGSLSIWQTTTALPTALYTLSASVWNNTIYIAGGTDQQNIYNTVYAANIQANGTLSTWTAQPSLPVAVVQQAQASSGVLYVVGGSIDNGLLVSAAVYYSKINADGSLGAWNQTAALPQAELGLGAVAARGYVFTLGGWNSVPTNGFYGVPVQGDGRLRAWAAGTSMPVALYNLGTAVTGSNIFVSGGLGNSGASSSVFSMTLPPPVPALTALGFGTNGSFQVKLTSSTNSSFSLQASADFTNWSNLGSGVTDASGSLIFQDPNATSFPQRYYRANWPLP